jgi:hypothetical protein
MNKCNVQFVCNGYFNTCEFGKKADNEFNYDICVYYEQGYCTNKKAQTATLVEEGVESRRGTMLNKYERENELLEKAVKLITRSLPQVITKIEMVTQTFEDQMSGWCKTLDYFPYTSEIQIHDTYHTDHGLLEVILHETTHAYTSSFINNMFSITADDKRILKEHVAEVCSKIAGNVALANGELNGIMREILAPARSRKVDTNNNNNC